MNYIAVQATLLFLVGCNASNAQTAQAGALRVLGVPEQGILVLDATPRGPIQAEQRFEGLRQGTHMIELYPVDANPPGAPLLRMPVEVRSGQMLTIRVEAPVTVPAPQPAPSSARIANEPPPRGHVEFPSALLSSGANFSETTVLTMLRTRRSAFVHCYESALRVDPAMSGSIRIRMSIDPAGTSYVEVFENALGRPVVDCVSNVISRFRFAPGPSNGTATFTFALQFSQDA